MKKKVIITICVILALALVGAGGWYLMKGKNAAPSDDGPGIYVEKIADIMGVSGSMIGLNDRFAGVVEPQKTISIQLDQERTVAEIYVSVDDDVKEGDPLFRYDNDTLSVSLERQKLELERIVNGIEQKKDHIAELEKQAANAYGDTLLQYTLEIQEAQADLKEQEYEQQTKELEIEKTAKAIDQSIVVSPITGSIRSINENSNNNQGYYGGETDNAFITIVVKGDFRVKGLINEQNVYQIMVGAPVTIRSRVNEEQTWTGFISEVDTMNPEQSNNNNYYYDTGDPMLQSSRYPFYISLDSAEGLMMGQHVYIEMGDAADFGPAHTDGVWLYDFYLMMDEEKEDVAYVYAEKNGRIEKRKVTLGQLDEETMQYEILSGLTQEDRIAWPDETVSEGNKVMN